ncbi:SMP-30/gluconolactonase/LRE family protein [Rhodovulum sp. DZ06]|uniref:SMP-30/gluconolactonase/LRE family protein n=1 Tax=Rhodovulum sp. DZ06 TaxID=3425126 RepID=UPI003D34ED4A
MAIIHDDRICALGEGPLWHPERQELFWFDITGRRLLSRGGQGARDRALPEMSSAAGWVDRDTLLVATETGLRRHDIDSGESEEVAKLEAGDPVTRSNDGRADPMGGFWIGTMGKRAERGAGAIYRFYKGRLEKLFAEISISNAICFSPDGRTAYFTDTPTRRVMAQALDEDGWPEGAPEVAVDLRGAGPGGADLYPDGAVTDAEGFLWIAQWGAGRVARHAPDGRFDRAVSVGGRHASCPAFGGEGLRTLFVTTATEGIEAPDAAQGVLYAADPGVAGRPEPRVIL